MMYLSAAATQRTSYLVPALHSEHFRTTSLMPSQTVKLALAHCGHHHAGKPFLQPATPRVVTNGGKVKSMRSKDQHNCGTPHMVS